MQHVNKGTAIDRLLAEKGIDPERTAGVGDTMGDRFIAERVSWFGCPANAAVAIKKSVAYVSPYHEVEESHLVDLWEFKLFPRARRPFYGDRHTPLSVANGNLMLSFYLPTGDF